MLAFPFPFITLQLFLYRWGQEDREAAMDPGQEGFYYKR